MGPQRRTAREILGSGRDPCRLAAARQAKGDERVNRLFRTRATIWHQRFAKTDASRQWSGKRANERFVILDGEGIRGNHRLAVRC